MKTLIKNITVLTIDKEMTILENAKLVVFPLFLITTYIMRK